MLSYLERQKEKKPAEIDEEHKVGKWFMGLIPCWIDAPSTLQPAHQYHGKNVIAIHLKDGGYRCCCVDNKNPITFCVAEDTHLVEGWKDRKPAEWSEKDEKLFISCMGRLQTWKPSKEQVRCLLDCVSKAKEIHNASVGGYDAYRILVSLYNDLQKLL